MEGLCLLHPILIRGKKKKKGQEDHIGLDGPNPFPIRGEKSKVEYPMVLPSNNVVPYMRYVRYLSLVKCSLSKKNMYFLLPRK